MDIVKVIIMNRIIYTSMDVLNNYNEKDITIIVPTMPQSAELARQCRSHLNPLRIDVHLHTSMSDGKLSVQELLHQCKQCNLRCVAITDHDTVKGVLALSSFEEEGMTILPGIEMSSFSETENQIHITGYFPRTADFRSIQSYLDGFVRQKRIERCKRILKNLEAAGYVVPYSMIEERTKNCAPSLPIISDCLIELGISRDYHDSFDRFLGNTTPFSEPLQLYPLQEAIDFIHAHHGVAAVAHPWCCSNPMKVCEDAVRLGIDGLECFPPVDNNDFGTTVYADFAKAHHLFCSSGSDYHGIAGMTAMLGENVFPQDMALSFVDSMKSLGIIQDVSLLDSMKSQSIS